jgi:hypothetical protein
MKGSLGGPILLTTAYVICAVGAFLASLPGSVEGMTGNFEPVYATAKPGRWLRQGLVAVSISFLLQIVWVWLDWSQR